MFDPTKYAVHGSTRDTFNLEIKSLKDTDVGEYSCETALANIVYGLHVVKLGLCAYDKFSSLIMYYIRYIFNNLCFILLDIQKFETNYGKGMTGPNLLLSCTVTFKTIGKWEPKIEISPGTFNTNYGNGVVTAYSNVDSPRDGQKFTCTSWFDDPPAGTFKHETPTHQYNHKAPTLRAHRTLQLIVCKQI